MPEDNAPIRRCAIYTRKSSEEGLEQDFNSLHAQREACEAYIRSQGGEGWRLIRTAYDDGGLSGGTMERPGLKCLLADIRQGAIDVVVVYKVDRLTRSLADFAKIVEEFDRHGVSFVAVTQQFNTTTSMGRLTLNILLSFAQFEREVTAERIRDKIAASKRKGMWMGGNLPLGYDVENRKLIINAAEAKTVTHIYHRYLALGCVRSLQEDLERRRILSKRRVSKDGHRSGGKPFSRGALYTILANPTYIGEIRHKSARYEGQHEAILERPLWDAVQEKLRTQRNGRRAQTRNHQAIPLAGKLFTENDERLTSSFTVKKGRRYRYYISQKLITGRAGDEPGWRLPAAELEMTVAVEVAKILHEPNTVSELVQMLKADKPNLLIARLKEDAARLESEEKRDEVLLGLIQRVTLGSRFIEIRLNAARWATYAASAPRNDPKTLRRKISLTLRRRGSETKLVIGELDKARRQDPVLTKVLCRALHWWGAFLAGTAQSTAMIAKTEKLSERYVRQVLQMAFLAPDLVARIAAGTQPIDFTWQRVMSGPGIPLSWQAQTIELFKSK